MSEAFEQHIQSIAQDLLYPPMKQVAAYRPTPYPMALMRRVAIALFVIGLVGFAIPDIRAAVLEILQIGAVTITLEGASSEGESLRLQDVSGETDLASVQDRVSYAVRVPDDAPDRVFLQEGELLIFVWLDGNEIVQALYQAATENWGIYKELDDVTQTSVHGDLALWLDVHHSVQFDNGAFEWTYFVQGNVLIWEENEVTYRLETEMNLEDARAFAEGLGTSD